MLIFHLQDQKFFGQCLGGVEKERNIFHAAVKELNLISQRSFSSQRKVPF